jgi:Uma2 family endonuclease
MLFPAAKSRITIQEYLDREASARDEHEYHDGEIHMMAGGTYRESKVILSAGAAIHARLEGHPCQASESNTRVAVQQRSTYVYPDLTVICGEPEFDPLDKRGTTLTNPAVVVEVLSDTTEAYDRGGKFDLYRDLPTLRGYVIISTSEATVASFLR